MDINPIVVRDCEDHLFTDTWALDLDGKTIAYVYSEDFASLLADIFNPKSDPLGLLDVIILLVRNGMQLVADFEKLRKQLEGSDEK